MNPRLDVVANQPLQGKATAATDAKKPQAPSSTGLNDRADATNVLAASTYDTAWTPTPKKYQYWAIKFKPYIDTQLKLTNRFYVDQIF